MKKFVKKNWTTIILLLIFLAGLCLLLYPTFSDWWNSFHQSRAIASYQEAVKDMSGEKKKAMLAAAHEYNERLAKQGLHFVLSEEEQAEYESLLDVSGTGIMGYIQVPSIDISFPIYHGTDEAILQVAIGHIAGSSLPVGGEHTHASVSGHRGLPSARLFTDLDQLVEGDVFTITVLDEVITYQVDQIRIVLPEETEELMTLDGDHCTLITCTPYGVNSHRMLVRGKRIDNIESAADIRAEATKIPNYLVIPAVGIPLLFIVLVIMLIYYRRKGPVRSGRELLDEFQKRE